MQFDISMAQVVEIYESGICIMPKIPEIEFCDIKVAENHIDGYDYERCKNGLWSIYNVIKKINLNCSDSIKVLECLYFLGVHSVFENNNMASLVYTGKTNKKYKRGLPSTKYLFQLEKYGFDFTNIKTLRKDIKKDKLAVKDIIQINLSYIAEDCSDVILGLKLFSDICVEKLGDCFYYGDIRVAFIDALPLYAPPVEEVFYFLPEEQKRVAYRVHEQLEKWGCVRNLEREYMTKYMHPKTKRQVFATIFASEDLYFLPESEKWRKLIFKFNLRNIGKYSDYLTKCTDLVRRSILETTDCYACKKACGGIQFGLSGVEYSKCPFFAFKFDDLTEEAVEDYLKLLALEINEDW
jgi:hypothetical protein